VEFCRWYPLAQAGDHAPVGENVVQLRIPVGLVDYPRGKSAMVHYAHAADARAYALGLDLPGDYLCRHLNDAAGASDLAGFCAKLTTAFEHRFGAVPHAPRRS
jgi:hypothetical protein